MEDKKKCSKKLIILLIISILLITSILIVAFMKLKTNNDESNETESGVQTSNETEYTDYSDILFDYSLAEGRFAVYFFYSPYTSTAGSTAIHAGDSVLLIAPDGTTMLYDINNSANVQFIVDGLQRLGIDTIDYLVLSHPHADHIGGQSSIFRYIKVKQVLNNGASYESAEYTRLYEKIEELQIPVTTLWEGDTFMFGDVNVKVYHPNTDFEFEGNENDSSLLMKFEWEDASVLLGGDLTSSVEPLLIEEYGSELEADIVKMNHHGSDGCNSPEWVKTLSAKIAVAQLAGVNDDGVWASYTKSGATTMYTGLDGAIGIFTDGDGTYEVQTQMDRANITYGVLNATNGRFTVE